MNAIYFLSDVHLGTGSAADEVRRQAALLDLIAEVRTRGAALHIVGDLFDFWFEYRSVVPRGHVRVLAALADLTSAGIPVTYLSGNHDFAIGSFFPGELGVAVVHGSHEFTASGTRFFLFHGDGLAPNDAGYRLLKRVLHSRWAQGAFRMLHPDWGFALARLTSHSSRDYTAARAYARGDGMREEAARRIAAGADIVVMGHRHVPCLEPVNGGTYVNLGEWLHACTYAVFTPETGIRLYTRREGAAEPWTGLS